MNYLIVILGVALAALASLGLARIADGLPLVPQSLAETLRARLDFLPDSIALANIAPGEYQGGRKTMIAGAAFTAPFLFCEVGGAANTVTVCNNAGDIPLGVICDEAASGENVEVALLGSADGTRKVTAGGNISFGDMICTGAAGKAVALPASAGTYYIVGRALEAAVDGQVFEFDPFPPIQRVVAG